MFTPRRAVTAGQTPLQAQVAACLVLLCAQPITRIVRLTIDDIIQANEEMFIRLGHRPIPVPEPFAAMLLDLTGNRQNMDTASNPRSRWLLSGRRVGQPLTQVPCANSYACSASPPAPPGPRPSASSCYKPRLP